MEAAERLARQIAFIVELDRLKRVLRQSLVTGDGRRENSAEHSWHLALMAATLAEYAAPGVDVGRATRMVLLHDVVEIDAGDTFAYDLAGQAGRVERETRAAARIFGLLPPDQAASLAALWREFEAGESADARFAVALDRLQPMLQNLHTEGGTWQIHGVTLDRVLVRAAPIREASPALWDYVTRLLEEAAASGLLAAGPEGAA